MPEQRVNNGCIFDKSIGLNLDTPNGM